MSPDDLFNYGFVVALCVGMIMFVFYFVRQWFKDD